MVPEKSRENFGSRGPGFLAESSAPVPASPSTTSDDSKALNLLQADGHSREESQALLAQYGSARIIAGYPAVVREPLIGAEDKRKALDTIRERGLNPDQARAFIMEHGYTRDEASAILVEDSDLDRCVSQQDVPANWRQMRLPGRPSEPNIPAGPTLPHSNIGKPEVASGE